MAESLYNEVCEVYLKQRVSIIDKYDIYDANDNAVFHVAGNMTGLKFEITNADGEKVATLSNKISLTKERSIELANGDKIEIKKKLMAIKEEFNGVYNEKALTVKGNLTALDFEITVDGEVVGTVKKKIAALRDTYTIRALNDKWLDGVVALAVAIDSAVHN